MLHALSNSSGNIFASREIWSWGGMIDDTTLGPLLRATSRLLMSCLIFQISTFLLAALGSSAVFSLPPPLGPVFGSRGNFSPVLAQIVGHFGFCMSVPLFTFSSLVQDLKSIQTLKLPKTFSPKSEANRSAVELAGYKT